MQMQNWLNSKTPSDWEYGVISCSKSRFEFDQATEENMLRKPRVASMDDEVVKKLCFSIEDKFAA